MNLETINLHQIAKLLGEDYEAVKKQFQRKKIAGVRRTNEKGKPKYFTVASLLEHGWIKPEQLSALCTSPLPAVAVNEGMQLMAASIVHKRYENLTESETSLLDSICPQWMTMRPGGILTALAHATHKSRSWLRRDHSIDKRKEKQKAVSKLNEEQRRIAQQNMLLCRRQKSFIEKCMADERLPEFSERSWRRVHNQLELMMTNEMAVVREGPEKMRSRLAPIQRDKTWLKPLEVIVGDFWRVDFVVKWIDGELVRPSLAVWVDWRTDMIVGVALTKHPNSLGVKTSLLHCFIHFGIPQYVYIDNGKEYLAHRIVGTKIESQNVKLDLSDLENDLKIFETKGILPALSINNKRALRRNPTGKIIERRFGRGGFTDWAKEFSNWSGANYWQKPEAVAVAERKFRKGSEKDYTDQKTGEIIHFMNLEELASVMSSFVERHNTRISNGFGMDGKQPISLWQDLIKLNPPRQASAKQIAYSFMEGRPLKVRSSGYIAFKKDFFFSSDTLLRMPGRPVHIRWNPIDGSWWNRKDGNQPEFLPNEIYVYDEDATYLTTATLVPRGDPLHGDVSLLMKHKMGVIKEAEENVKALISPKIPVVDVTHQPEEVMKQIKAEDEEKKKDPLKNNPYRNTFI